MNQVILTGRLTKNVEVRHIPTTGTLVASFTLAVQRDYLKKDGTREVDFIPVEVMGKVAEFCVNYLSKGRLVAVQGSLRVDRYQDKTTQEFKIFTKVAARSIQALDKNPNNTDSADNTSNTKNTKKTSNKKSKKSKKEQELDKKLQELADSDIPF